jgi:hypothetical protein
MEDEDEYPETLKHDYPCGRFAASHFLREVIPTHCIAYLRFLELVFPAPPYRPPTWPQTDHPVMQDWRETVGWLRDKINGPGLTVRLIVPKDTSYGGPEPVPITVAEGDRIHDAYLWLSQSFKLLTEGPNALARFYTHPPYPWKFTAEVINYEPYNERRDWLKAKKRAIKTSIERHVMGDRYDDLYANGRQEPAKSLWQHVEEAHH